MLYALLSVLLFSIPLIFKNGFGDSIRYPKEAISVLGLVLAVVLSLCHYSFRPFRDRWLSAFLVWCTTLTIFNLSPIPLYFPNTVLSMPTQFFAWKELFYIFLSVMTIYYISSFIRKEDDYVELPFGKISFNHISLGTIFKIIVFSSFISSVYAIIQAIGFDELFRTCDPNTGWVAVSPFSPDKGQIGEISRRVVACAGNPSILSVWIAMCMPFALSLKSKLGFITLVLNIIVLIITQSTTGIAGALLGMAVYLFFKNKKIFMAVFLSFLILSGITAGTPGIRVKILNKSKSFLNPTGRIAVHKEAWKILENKPITGVGLGTFEPMVGFNPNVTTKLNNENWRELHDEFGQLWWSTGLIGLGIFLCFILSTIRKFLRNVTGEGITLFSALSVFLLTSVTYFNFRVAPESVYGLILTGLFLREIEKERII